MVYMYAISCDIKLNVMVSMCYTANERMDSDTSSDIELRSTSSVDSQTSIIELTYVSQLDDWEDEEINIIDRMYMEDLEFVDGEKEHGQYYIANAFRKNNFYLLGLCVSPRLFFRYGFHDITQYMYEYLIHYQWSIIPKRSIDIIQLYIENHLYKCVIKTHWLRLIQRHWKHAYAERKKVIQLRKTIRNIKYFQLHGRYVYGANYLPSLHGLLSQYNTRQTNKQ